MLQVKSDLRIIGTGTGMDYIFIAKFGKDGKWLPLSQHLQDTADIMRHLCGRYVISSMAVAAGLDIGKFTALAVFCAAVHDIGKATASFQYKITDHSPEYRKYVEQQGFSVLLDEKEKYTPHALAGGTILNRIFDVDESICDVVAAHHGVPRSKGRESKFNYQLKRFAVNYYGNSDGKMYEEAWHEIFNWAFAYSGVIELNPISVKGQMILSGLLIMADWIASNEDYFPLFQKGLVENTDGRAGMAIERLNLPFAWEPEYAAMDDETFSHRFGNGKSEFKPNGMQKDAIALAESRLEPGVMIIEAPMGTGKTEAALAVAEIMSCQSGAGGIFFGLPTQGTANGIFPRLMSWAANVSEGMRVSVNLAHGQARDNALFDSYRSNTCDEPGIQINAWMAGRHKALLPDFVVGTVDQALMAAFRKKFVMLLHLGLAGKTVIIDEIHSYDSYMSTFMETLLSWLGAYGIPVILLSATLTKDKRNDFLSAYTGRKSQVESDAYPLISWASAAETLCVEGHGTAAHRTDVSLDYIDSAETCGLLEHYLEYGGCAGVVMDTVGAAQSMSETLREMLPSDYTIILLHSRFLPADRSELENKVLEQAGGSKDKCRNKTVIVGTQVLEQSLDIDFDILFTDWCPVDLLFQRLGRLHRHNRVRPKRLMEAKCYIFDDAESNNRADCLYYKYILRRTRETLQNIRTVTIPDDIRYMIESVYDTDTGSDGEDKQEYIAKLNGLKNIAGQFCIQMPDKAEFCGMLDQRVEGEGGVRYGINNMDVILLKDIGECLETFSGTRLSTGHAPEKKELMELFRQKLSVRYKEDFYEAVKSARNGYGIKWLEDPMFKYYDFIITDKEGNVSLGSHKYSYTHEYGWREEN